MVEALCALFKIYSWFTIIDVFHRDPNFNNVQCRSQLEFNKKCEKWVLCRFFILVVNNPYVFEQCAINLPRNLLLPSNVKYLRSALR